MQSIPLFISRNILSLTEIVRQPSTKVLFEVCTNVWDGFLITTQCSAQVLWMSLLLGKFFYKFLTLISLRGLPKFHHIFSPKTNYSVMDLQISSVYVPYHVRETHFSKNRIQKFNELKILFVALISNARGVCCILCVFFGVLKSSRTVELKTSVNVNSTLFVNK